ncbi:YrdB family protein [Metabacillus idriensis]|uniref:YrdB family protein n=1 Tax=Metabacillus idriensis TaxID=324768 RepID=UPI001C8D57F8|nr:YrdB family protein [Metabacillus idriensis]
MSFLLGLKTANLALRFILELCALAAAGYWGFKAVNTWFLKGILGIGTPLVIAVVWGLFGSPKAAILLSPGLHLILEVIVFGLPIIFLLLAGKIGLAWMYGIAAVINKVLMHVWNQ